MHLKNIRRLKAAVHYINDYNFAKTFKKLNPKLINKEVCQKSLSI